MHEYWLKQSNDKPLFEDILWSRPESKMGAGKLAVIGGNSHGFNAPGMGYQIGLESGVGICRVLMPDAVKKTVGYVLPDADFAPSTPSGSFAKNSLDEMLQIASWSDGVLLAGDLGRNSETAVVVESFFDKFNDTLVVSQDAVDYFKSEPKQLLGRPHTVICLSLAQLQKFFINIPLITPITYSMSTVQLIEALHELTEEYQAIIVTKHNDLILISSAGKVVTMEHDFTPWRVAVAARASVFALQNPERMFEAVVSSLIPDSTQEL